MKVLIDEQLPTKLKYRFDKSGHEVLTVRDMNWLGKKNGELLSLMIQNGFDILITNDKNLYYQQKINHLKLSIININTKTNRYDDVLNVLVAVNDMIDHIASANDSADNYYILYP